MDLVDDPDICDLGTTEAMDEVASSMRCLVYYVLSAATLGAIGFFAGLVWLATRIGG